MKGVILAAGNGTRLRYLTNGKNKCLTKIEGISLLQHNIENLCRLTQISSCVVVVGYGAEDIMREIGNTCNGKNITYCMQLEQTGLIDALECAAPTLEGDDFFMLLGDERVINHQYAQAINVFQQTNILCHVGIIKAPSEHMIKKTYTFIMDDHGNLDHFIEKPDNPYNYYMGTGNIIFKATVLNLLSIVPISSQRGEKELVGLLNLIATSKNAISYFIVGDAYINVNTKDDLVLLQSK